LQEINQPITKCNIDKVVNELHDILYSCTEQQQKPKNNNPKRRPNRKDKWTPEIHKAMKLSKNQFAKWKALTDFDGSFVIYNKSLDLECLET
jgi:hypothetical protein